MSTKIAQGIDSEVYTTKNKKHILKVYGKNTSGTRGVFQFYADIQSYVAKKGPFIIKLDTPIKIDGEDIDTIKFDILALDRRIKIRKNRKGTDSYIAKQTFVPGQTLRVKESMLICSLIAQELNKHIVYDASDITPVNIKVREDIKAPIGTLVLTVTDIGAIISDITNENSSLISQILRG